MTKTAAALLVAGICQTLLSCSAAPTPPHLLEVYRARFPDWSASATEGYPQTHALEDLGTVSESALRLVYFSFSWSLAVNSVHGTHKILIFRAPDLYMGEVYLNHPLDTARTELRGTTLRIVCEDGHSSELLFADPGVPETRGALCVGPFHPE